MLSTNLWLGLFDPGNLNSAINYSPVVNTMNTVSSYSERGKNFFTVQIGNPEGIDQWSSLPQSQGSTGKDVSALKR
jgi:hypothetical protein